MTSYMWIVLFATFVFATGQEGFDLLDALGDDDVTPKPDVKPPKKDGELDLFDALNPDIPSEPKKPASNPTKTGGDLDLLDGLDDAKKPAPPSGGGGRDFSDSDLFDVAGNDHNPDGGKGRSGGGSYDSTGDASGETPDVNQQWLHLLKLLGNNIPENLHAWIDNCKQVIVSLLKMLLELLDSLMGEK